MDITNLRQTQHPSILITIISGLSRDRVRPHVSWHRIKHLQPNRARRWQHANIFDLTQATAVPSCESAHGLLLAANERSTKV
ncbi:hypothetical protein E4U61_004323 [Claviceps capensis]|nr:hypothetical protein E4U61_004323 [Claviceps capensis]